MRGDDIFDDELDDEENTVTTTDEYGNLYDEEGEHIGQDERFANLSDSQD